MKKRSNSETGHAKNVANFEDLISRCVTFSAQYNPPRPELQLGNLQQKHEEAKMVLHTLAMAELHQQSTTNQAASAFKALRPLTTRIINAMIACGFDAKSIEDARSLQRLINGARAKKKSNGEEAPASEEPTEPMTESTEETAVVNESRTISTSRQSQDMLLEHFSKLVLLAQREPKYTPNEPELQLPGLQMHEQELRRLVTAAANATSEVEAARIRRWEVLYKEPDSLVPLALQVKSYVLSLFGSTSPQYKQIKKLSFRNLG